ncbi:hypothetical protein BHE74_00050768 [Ensete ventricosum]|nr:hypothetical protein BHE74_00050768 [Ensete ventricosum]
MHSCCIFAVNTVRKGDSRPWPGPLQGGGRLWQAAAHGQAVEIVARRGDAYRHGARRQVAYRKVSPSGAALVTKAAMLAP